MDYKYIMIVTSEDERYRRGVGLEYFADKPWEGLLEEVVYGNRIDELYGNWKNEGLFYQVYDTETGKRIGYGMINSDCPRAEIEEWEKTIQKQKEEVVRHTRIELAKELWNRFGEIPLNVETECIEEVWNGFPVGTHREKIWRWFEEAFDVSVAEDLIGGSVHHEN